eukprot:scaffold11983_cov15-Tisochrysis_lutea.AAC.2
MFAARSKLEKAGSARSLLGPEVPMDGGKDDEEDKVPGGGGSQDGSGAGASADEDDMFDKGSNEGGEEGEDDPDRPANVPRISMMGAMMQVRRLLCK